MIRVFASGQCRGRFAEAGVTANGRFAVCPIPDFRWSFAIMGHRFYDWTLCTQVDEDWVPLHHDKSYGLADSGPTGTHYLSCSVGSESCQAAPADERSVLDGLLHRQCE